MPRRTGNYDDYDTEFQEPAMKEIRHTRSCLRRTCFSGCGCLVMVLAITLAVAWIFAPPQADKINVLPEHFPQNIPLYKPESVARITHLKPEQKKRGPETAALIPKILLAPVFLALEGKPSAATSTPSQARTSAWHAFKDIIKSPLQDYTHTIIIEWENLSAQPVFIDEWYQNELRKAGFNAEHEFAQQEARIINFFRGDITGTIRIENATDTAATERVIVQADYF